MIRFFTAALAAAAMLCFSAAGARAQTAEADLPAIAAAIDETMRAHHFDPAVLNDPAYRALHGEVEALAQRAGSREAFVSGFNALWREGPFSHVNLTIAEASAADTAAYLDQMRVGEGARLSWDGEIAILTVNTMMGLDTIEQIDAAYGEIAARQARALIIDLRANEGGAFAVRPLVAHLLTAPLDAGAFVSQAWAAEMSRAPVRADVEDVPPWDGWSLVAFWRDVERARITRIQFTPSAPHYGGPVFVLIGPRTASAAELAADALAASGRATIIGERSVGQMLSQKPYDLPGGLQLFLPIADYYAFRGGRIEGRGVAPDVPVPADQAMAEAMARAVR
ncbi:MAG: S41 family peptidase [Hyphomonadaceae bacterium]